jgi:hypothetical protein
MVGGGGTSDKDDPCYRSPSPGKKSRPLVDFFLPLTIIYKVWQHDAAGKFRGLAK